MARSLLPCAVLAAAALLAGCGSTPPKTALRGIDVIADEHINQGSAAALDIVFVYDTAAATTLPKTGPQWFLDKQAFKDGLADRIDVVTIEMVRASTSAVTLPARAGKAVAVYAFANYVSADGQHVANLTPYTRMTIRLTNDKVLYSGS